MSPFPFALILPEVTIWCRFGINTMNRLTSAILFRGLVCDKGIYEMQLYSEIFHRQLNYSLSRLNRSKGT